MQRWMWSTLWTTLTKKSPIRGESSSSLPALPFPTTGSASRQEGSSWSMVFLPNWTTQKKMNELLEIYNLGKLTQGETERLSTPRMAKEIESVTKTSQQRRAQGQKASGWIPSDIQRRFMLITSKVLQEAKEKMTFPNSCCKANIILWYQSETGKLQENIITGHYPW